MKALVAVLAGLVLAGCAAARPALMADLDELRGDQIAAARQQRDAFTTHLAEHPGDVAGAAGKAFGVNVKAQEDSRAQRQAEESGGGGIPVVPTTAAGLALLVAGLAWKRVKPVLARTLTATFGLYHATDENTGVRVEKDGTPVPVPAVKA